MPDREIPRDTLGRAITAYNKATTDAQREALAREVARLRVDGVQRGVGVSEIQVMGENPTPQPDPLDNVGFVFFSDPDGNGWAVQQISARG